ncbi:hypothetical protein QKU48_gp1188 [Fadolivirus algeromassiliense]|jgi:hypothetical protein|uniref:Uncharacterized protein n=1 Tax=Fadolivirus FV1/VV64 TaxID=3070911 RepID=A0A7D3QWJ0_9VIRU|nr:hypothetical protein QKU48_gp1188 [Fadolivirus algeromassiliense]QKF94646.1 hypothetical protein Fadolivirus_1_1188 [Fadolivirus FV1/VV64]
MKRVRFSKQNKTKVCTIIKKYNCVKNRRLKQKQNRRLRNIERYMRANDLLLNSEYLEFRKHHYKHIRGDYINFICQEEGWIGKKEYLKIIY